MFFSLFRFPLFLFVAFWGVLTSLATPAQAAPPNILFILTDDQGYGDLSVHGNPVLKTPHLDKLHAESVRFTDFRVSPTCSPTRSALLTGRHEFKNGITHTIMERERLPLSAPSVAQLLKENGYSTAIFGKWHLGDEPDRWPSRRGFDETFIHGAGGIGQSFPGTCADAPNNSYFDPFILHNGKFEKTSGYCTDVFFRQATQWIAEGRPKEKPFFVWLATNAPHAPLNCPQEWSAPYVGKVPDETARFFGMIANIDQNVGQLLDRLRALDLERNTVVIFMNDNGTAHGAKVWNAGMFGAKGSAENGGTRANSFWRWPGTLTPGDRPQLTAHVDFFPTLAELAGANIPPAVRTDQDGQSLVPLLRDPSAPWPADRMLPTHLGRWKPGTAPEKYGVCSVRWQNYLTVRRGNRWAVFDIAADPGQQRDLAAEKPELLARVNAFYDRWWDSILPRLENESAYATAPDEAPFHKLFREQFPDSAPPKKSGRKQNAPATPPVPGQ
jgi:arylsulfatase